MFKVLIVALLMIVNWRLVPAAFDEPCASATRLTKTNFRAVYNQLQIVRHDLEGFNRAMSEPEAEQCGQVASKIRDVLHGVELLTMDATLRRMNDNRQRCDVTVAKLDRPIRMWVEELRQLQTQTAKLDELCSRTTLANVRDVLADCAHLSAVDFKDVPIDCLCERVNTQM
jgi:hypothetical protein